MAEFIDNEELTSGEFPDLEAETETEVVAEKPAEKAPEVPEKYRGKSVEDIVRMHQEAEKLIGKQAQEVGEVRKLADELLRQQLSKTNEPTTKEEDTEEVDFFADPQKAVARAVENHPSVKKAEEAVSKAAQKEAQRELLSKHPDMTDIVQNPEFIDWVKQSRVRVSLYMAADQKFDTEAADELLSTYKALNANRQPKADTSTVTREDAEVLRQSSLKAAAVDASGTGEAPKKVYRRADLIRLRMQDPDRYNAMQDEILRAYAENRVK